MRERIRALANNTIHVKNDARLVDNLDLALLARKRLGNPVVGWFELDNFFMFFSDRKMWVDFCDLFEVTPCEVPDTLPTPDYTKLGKKELCQVAVHLGVFRTKSEANKLAKGDLLAKIQPRSVKSAAEGVSLPDVLAPPQDS